jgi:hypothetical protein
LVHRILVDIKYNCKSERVYNVVVFSIQYPLDINSKYAARIIVPIANVISINGNPILNHLLKVMRCPNFSLNPTATIPALDPINVPFPPRSAPNAKAHHRGLN